MQFVNLIMLLNIKVLKILLIQLTIVKSRYKIVLKFNNLYQLLCLTITLICQVMNFIHIRITGLIIISRT